MQLVTHQKLVGIMMSISALLVSAFLLTQSVWADGSTTALPNADGSYKQWARVPSGSTHYTAVDESACNGTSDYIRETSAGQRESFSVSLTSVPNGVVITDIALVPCASRNSGSGGGSSQLDVFYLWSGAQSADAGGYALTGTTPADLSTTTFSGLALSKNSSSTLEIGAVYTSGNRGVRLSRLAAIVTYITAPAAPSDLVAGNTSHSENDLSWTDNSSNESGFSVERSLNSQFGPFTEIASTSANVEAYHDSGLTSDQTYYYRVRAFNVAGNSSYSATAYAITATSAPSAPTNLQAVASTSSALLTWSQSSTNEEGFVVERGVDGVNFSDIATKSINVTSHADSGLSSGTYYYRVRAFNVIGDSSYSNTATSTIP